MEIVCPKCRLIIDAPENVKGSHVRCYECNYKFLVDNRCLHKPAKKPVLGGSLFSILGALLFLGVAAFTMNWLLKNKKASPSKESPAQSINWEGASTPERSSAVSEDPTGVMDAAQMFRSPTPEEETSVPE